MSISMRSSLAVATMASPARPIWGWPVCASASLSGAAIVGGACVTEEFHPGFRNSIASYTVSLLQPKIINDLKLREHGLRLVERRAQNFLPLPDGRYLLTGEARTDRQIAKFSARDAARYPAYQAEIGRLAEILRSLALTAPPNFVLGDIAQTLRGLGRVRGDRQEALAK